MSQLDSPRFHRSITSGELAGSHHECVVYLRLQAMEPRFPITSPLCLIEDFGHFDYKFGLIFQHFGP